MEYYRPEPPLPEKKDPTLLRILLAGCAVLLIVGVGFGIFFGKFFSFTKAPTKTVRTHLEAINKRDYEQAYSLFTTDYRRSNSFEDFRTEVGAFSPLLPYRDLKLHSVKIVNDQASVDGTLTGRDGSVFPVHYELIRKKEIWKISSFEWTSPGERQTI